MNDTIDRRAFLGQGLVLGGIAAAGPAISFPAAVTAQTGADLVVVKGDIRAAVNKAVQTLGGMSRFVKPGQSVFIKPNMSFASSPDAGANTHPEVVAEVARLCADAGAKSILIGDFPLKRPEACLEKSGILEAIKGIPKTSFRYFTDKKFFEPTPVPRAKKLRKVKLLKPAYQSDVLISLPVAKSHGSAQVSMSMKNMMGVIYNRRAFHTTYPLDQAIADLTSLVWPKLVLLDASRVMASGGPGGPGTVEWLNTIIAGTNPVEVDALGVTLSDWDGKKITGDQVKQLKAAHELGLGNIEADKLKRVEIQV